MRSSAVGERLQGTLVRAGKQRELVPVGASSKAIVDTRWVLTWKMVGSKKDVKFRLAAKGYQGPDLESGSVETPGCVSFRSSHPRARSLGAIEKWGICSLDNENALWRTASAARYFSVRQWNRIRVGLTVFGTCMPRHMG